MRKVILDANFLLLPFQFKIDIFGEIEALIGRFEPIVLSTTIEELKKLSAKKSSKISRLALSALKVAEKCRLIEARAKPGENYDDVLLRVAREESCLVATNDRKLRNKLRETGVPTIFLRQRSYLQVEGYI